MNLQQLRYARRVAEHGSFSRAAESCSVSQPALSSAVAQLEQELGGKLFERTTREVVLTPFGRHALPLIEEVLAAQEALVRGLQSFIEPTFKIARIGLSPLVDTRRVTTALAPYRQRHPDVEVFFKECLLDEIDDRLARGQIDFAVRPVRPDSGEQSTLRRQIFYADQLMFLPRHDEAHPTSSIGQVLLQNIACETIVVTQGNCGLGPVVRGLFTSNGLALNEYRGQALSYRVLEDWAELGIAAAILPSAKVSASNRTARPLFLNAKRPARVSYEVVWPEGATQPKHIAEILTHWETSSRVSAGIAE